MAHKDWCGKPCGECASPYRLDETIPCSPDCEALNEDASRKVEVCSDSGCNAIISDINRLRSHAGYRVWVVTYGEN